MGLWAPLIFVCLCPSPPEIRETSHTPHLDTKETMKSGCPTLWSEGVGGGRQQQLSNAK